MAGLRGDVRSMRNLPAEPQLNAFAKHVAELPEERSFIDKISGNSGLDPGNAKDHPLISNYLEAIKTGQLSPELVEKAGRRNPKSRALFTNALDEYRRFSALQSSERDILSRNFG